MRLPTGPAPNEGEAATLARAGAEGYVDAIEVSGGGRSSRENGGRSRKLASAGEPHFAAYAAQVRQDVDMPVIASVGTTACTP
jgi:hypothetical protein